jgi:phage head maturation protease
MTELTRASIDAVSVRGEGEGEGERLIELRIAPFGVVGQTTEGPEIILPGAFAGVDPSRVTIEAGAHGGPLVGRGLELTERDDAAYMLARIARTAAGDELLTLAREGVLRDASIAFVPDPKRTRRRKGVTVREGIDLRRVAVLERGAYPGAEVIAVRTEGTRMGDMDTTAELGLPTPTAELVTRPELADALMELRRSMAEQAVTREDAFTAVRAWRSFGDALTAAIDSAEAAAILGRALADEITGENPGVVPPAWLTDVKGIIAQTRPAVNAFGTISPGTGMGVDFPYFDGDLAALVGKQATQKTEITSVKVSIKKGSATLDTYAGGSDIALQLIRRSSPSYLEAYGRIMAAAWALVTDKAAVTAIETAAPDATIVIPWATATKPEDMRAAAFELSLAVQEATGSPASFLLASTSAFLNMGKLLQPAPYSPTNASGLATARTLAVELSGLPVIHDANVAAGTVIASNGLAGAWAEDGPSWVSALDVAKLGEDRAIWSLGGFVPYLPAGIVVTKAASA